MQCRGFRSDATIQLRKIAWPASTPRFLKGPKLVKFRQPSLGARFVMSPLVARLHDAAVTPEAWPDAVTALTDAAGVAGAALIIFNKSTGKVDEAHFCGLSAGFKSDYVRPLRCPGPYSHCSMEAGKSS